MSNPNTKKQNDACDEIHKIAKKANMSVFMLVDEDLEIYDDECDFTQDEKFIIFERVLASLSDQYGEILSEVIEEVKSDRY
jgi:hypothetical protein